jgi:DNA-binding winged helix-turn-helix (wHTH) protein
VLTSREFAILLTLVEHAGQVVSRERLKEALYGWGEKIESNAVQVHVHHLRKKLGKSMIRTIHAIGYTADKLVTLAAMAVATAAATAAQAAAASVCRSSSASPKRTTRQSGWQAASIASGWRCRSRFLQNQTPDLIPSQAWPACLLMQTSSCRAQISPHSYVEIGVMQLCCHSVGALDHY